jgi:carbonic anhydrase
MKKTFKLMTTALVLTSLISCQQKAEQTTENSGTLKIQEMETPVKSILTAEDQAGMTADEIIGRLKKGGEILKTTT